MQHIQGNYVKQVTERLAVFFDRFGIALFLTKSFTYLELFKIKKTDVFTSKKLPKSRSYFQEKSIEEHANYIINYTKVVCVATNSHVRD